MDRRDVPSQSPVNSHSFFDSSPGHVNPALRSPALSHERPYGMHSLPSAFSMMGRRPTLSHSSPDFLTQDPMLGSQPSLSPSSHLHSGIGSATGAPPWSWMPPHPHITSPDFFQSHMSGAWLGHDHERSRERIDDCLFTSPRAHGPLMNGAGSAGSFSAGSGIFYPHPSSSAPSVHSFPHHSSSWSNHNNHGQRGSFDHGDNHDTDLFSLSMRPRHPSISSPSDDSTKNLINKHAEIASYLPADREHRLIDKQQGDKQHDRSMTDSTGVFQSPHYQDKTIPLQISPSIIKGVKSKTPPIITKPPVKEGRYPESKMKELKTEESRLVSTISPPKVQPIKTEGVGVSNKQPESSAFSLPATEGSAFSLPATEGSAFSLPAASHDSKVLPPPPKLTKTKAPPPPRLQVPKSILNDREGIIPKVFIKSVDGSEETNSNFPQKQALDNSVNMSSLNSGETIKETTKLSASKEALLQKLKERPGLQKASLSDSKKTVGATVETSKQPVTSKASSSAAPKPSITSPPKIPSGKPLHMARFRVPYRNEDTSDEESDSSEASSESGSGSGESEEEEGEGKEGEESGSDTESDSDGSENEEEDGGDDDEDEEDEDEQSGILISQEENDSSALHGKRGISPTASESPRKRRRAINEDAVEIPIQQGWRRQTRLRPIGPQGTFRGDVYYFGPCGKKLRTYPDVTRYLAKNNITNLVLENFSFSTKLHIGEILEWKEGNNFEMLSQEEVQRRKNEVDAKNKAKMEKLTKRSERRVQKTVEVRKMKKLERIQAIQQARQAKRDQVRMRQEQKMVDKENLKQQRHMEKLRKQEQIRLEKELKAHKAQEVRRSKKRDVASAKYEEAVKKAKDRELKRQQALLLKQQDKEQKRQQQMMIRALEIQRKNEERERQKEEKRTEKKLVKERKLEQKRREMILARELKKPVEDMVLRDAKELPSLPRLDECIVSGKAFADIVMVKEFVENFGEAIDIDPSTELPSIQDIQLCLLNEGEDVLLPLCQSLLAQALEDPGCDGPYSVTALGQHLHKVELNENNVSEMLRLFILSRSAGEHELADSLLQQPFQSLSPIQKIGSLAFLCNELLCSRTICGEIENSIENMSNLRKDKWVIEGKIRKLKAIQAEKYPVVKIKKPPGRPRADIVVQETNESNKDSSSVAGESNQGNDDDEEEEEEDDDDDDDDDDEEGGEGGENGADGSEDSDEEDDDTEPQTQEELERRLKKLEKKHAQFRSKLFNHSHSLRALSLGQDRCKRRYWVLPRTGGVYIEGMGSAEIEGQTDIVKEGEEVQGDRERVEKMDINAAIQEGTRNKKRNISCLNESGFNSSLNDAMDTSTNSTPSTSTCSTPQFVKIENLSNSATCSPTLIRTEVMKRSVWFGLLPRMPCDESSLTLSHTPFSGGFVSTYSKKAEGTPVDSPISVKRPPGRPPKNTTPVYQTIVSGLGGASPFTVVQGQQQMDTSPMGTPPQLTPCTIASSTPRVSTMSLSFEELKKSVLESLRREPAPIPPELQHGWWRLVEPTQIKDLTKTLHCRGIREKMLQKNFQKYSEYIATSAKKPLNDGDSDSESEDEEDEQESKDKKVQPEDDDWFPAQEFAVNKSSLKEVEELEEKVFAASLQIKGWKLPAKISKTLSFANNDFKENGDNNLLSVGATRLASLELGIERRYLKHPFRDDKLQIPSNIGTALAPGEVPTEANSTNEEEYYSKAATTKPNITSALRTWRNAVAGVTNASQLSMCLTLLMNCIAWEKSIMKVFCQMCRKGDNEELLLLCDACDRGYHTYCCTPKLSCIPEGDWYCMDCIVLASGGDNCCVCGGATGKMAKCDNCPRNFHLRCLEPPLVKLPRSSWTCPNCKRRKKTRTPTRKPRDKKKEREAEEARAEAELQLEFDDEQDDDLDAQEPRHNVNRKQTSKDMAPCRTILAEMEKHDDAWPFLVPVNAKQFPEYYKIIRKPMDFHTMKIKLRDYQYISRQEFIEDSRLVFRNCNEFNEDDSEVGQAGKRIAIFFENRWKELVSQENGGH